MTQQTACNLRPAGGLQKALPNNGLVVAWSEAGRLAVGRSTDVPAQGRLF